MCEIKCDRRQVTVFKHEKWKKLLNKEILHSDKYNFNKLNN